MHLYCRKYFPNWYRKQQSSSFWKRRVLNLVSLTFCPFQRNISFTSKWWNHSFRHRQFVSGESPGKEKECQELLGGRFDLAQGSDLRFTVLCKLWTMDTGFAIRKGQPGRESQSPWRKGARSAGGQNCRLGNTADANRPSARHASSLGRRSRTMPLRSSEGWGFGRMGLPNR